MWAAFQTVKLFNIRLYVVKDKIWVSAYQYSLVQIRGDTRRYTKSIKHTLKKMLASMITVIFTPHQKEIHWQLL